MYGCAIKYKRNLVNLGDEEREKEQKHTTTGLKHDFKLNKPFLDIKSKILHDK